MRHATLLDRTRAALLVIDIQTRVHAAMRYRQEVESNALKLIQGFRLLRVPILFTEQYPQGLGPTLPALREAMGDLAPFAKMSFSCCGQEDLLARLSTHRAAQVVVCGIETHVCILQTALDLLARGLQVHVVRDAVSSRHELNHETALARMRAAGVIISSTESVLFELMQRADIPEFKSISALVK